MPFLIDKTYIEDKFQAYIQSKVKPLNYECVIEPYDGPTYQQYVGILVSQDESVGGDSRFNDEIDDEYTEYLKTETRFSVRVTVWGGDAWDIAKRIEKIFKMSEALADFWTDIGEWVDSKGKKHKEADSPRYKALGNSIALPYWSWMAKKMVKQLKDDGVENPTMASLFDGIGEFHLVYSRHGCIPVWASEIEEFPIAVTKLHFKEQIWNKSQ